MCIDEIEKKIAVLAKEKGYNAVIVSNGEPRAIKFPAALIMLPKVLNVSFTDDFGIYHSVCIRLVDNFGPRKSEASRVYRMVQMQNDALAIVSKLSLDEEVIVLNDLEIVPIMAETVNHGNLLQRVTFKVASKF